VTTLELWLRWLLGVIGFIYLLTESGIFANVRTFFSSLARTALNQPGVPHFAWLYCPPCMGFWIGLVLGILGYWPLEGDFMFLESAIAAMAVGAVWKTYFTNPNVFEGEHALVTATVTDALAKKKAEANDDE